MALSKRSYIAITLTTFVLLSGIFWGPMLGQDSKHDIITVNPTLDNGEGKSQEVLGNEEDDIVSQIIENQNATKSTFVQKDNILNEHSDLLEFTSIDSDIKKQFEGNFLYSKNGQLMHRNSKKTTIMNTDKTPAYSDLSSVNRLLDYFDELPDVVKISDEYVVYSAVLSPFDGKWAYMEIKRRSTDWNLWVYDPNDNSHELIYTNVTTPVENMGLAPFGWNSSNSLILEANQLKFTSDYQGIWKLNLDTKTIEEVILSAEYIGTPIMSPDGKTLIYTATTDFPKHTLHSRTTQMWLFDFTTQEDYLLESGSSFHLYGWTKKPPSDVNLIDKETRAKRGFFKSSFSYKIPFPSGVKYQVTRAEATPPTGPIGSNEICDSSDLGDGHPVKIAHDWSNRILVGGEFQEEFSSSTDGIVVFSGIADPEGFGQYIKIEMPNGNLCYYGHCSSWYVDEGDCIVQGQIIGREGDEGAGSTAEHLHQDFRAPSGASSTTYYVQMEDCGGCTPYSGYCYTSGNTVSSCECEMADPAEPDSESDPIDLDITVSEDCIPAYLEGYICQAGDIDYYQTFATSGGILNLTLNTQNTGKNYVLDIYQQTVDSWSLIETTHAEPQVPTTVNLEVTQDAILQFRVRGFESEIDYNSELPYLLEMTCTSIVVCEDDYEPNDNPNQRQNIFPECGSSNVNETFDSYICAPTDVDWYSFNTTAPGKIKIKLNDVPNGKNYLLSLFYKNLNPDGTYSYIDVGFKSYPAGLFNWIKHTESRDILREYIVAVTGVTNDDWSDTQPYTIELDWSCPDGGQNAQEVVEKSNSTVTVTASPSSICSSSQSVSISVSSTHHTFDYYNGSNWNILCNNCSTNETISDVSPGTTIVVVGDDADGCSILVGAVTIGSSSGPNISITPSTPQINEGGSVVLTANGASGASCQWSPTTGLSNPNSCNPTASPTSDKTYTVTVDNGQGCESSASVIVQVLKNDDGGSGGCTAPNDDPCDAIELTVHNSLVFTQGNNFCATDSDVSNLTCDGTSGEDVWYKLTIPNTEVLAVIMREAGLNDVGLGIYRGNCNNLTYMGCVDSFEGINTYGQYMPFALILGEPTGTEIYLRVWDYLNDENGTFDIAVIDLGLEYPDLVLSIDDVSDSNPNQGETITVEYTICNNSSVPVDTIIDNHLYLVSNGSFQYLPDFSVGFVGLDAFACRSFPPLELKFSEDAEDGQYVILVTTDLTLINNKLKSFIPESVGHLDLSRESDNNFKPIYITLGDADPIGHNFTVYGFDVDPDDDLVGGQTVVDFDYRVKNHGNIPYDGPVKVWIILSEDDDYDEDRDIIVREDVFYLDAGESDELESVFTAPIVPDVDEEDWNFIAIIDPLNELFEYDEDNDDREGVTYYVPQTEFPDYEESDDMQTIQNGITSPNLTKGVPYQVTFTIDNNGDADAENSSKVRLYIAPIANQSNTTYLGQQTISAIAEGQSEAVSINVTNTNFEGNYVLIAEIDEDDDVNEGNGEGNNKVLYPVNFEAAPALPDYVGSNFHVEQNGTQTSDVIIGQQFNMSLDVTNIGSVIADSTTNVHFILSTDSVVDDVSDLFLDSVSIGILSPNMPTPIALSYTFTDLSLAGSYELIAAIDYENKVEESDENNLVLISINLIAEIDTSICHYQDSLALIALYESTDGANWTNTWQLGQPMDTWYGIKLDNDGCVTCIDLDGDFDCFDDANVEGNNLYGNIPTEIGNLSQLVFLDISFNELSGVIPNSLGNLPNLEYLNLASNHISGGINTALANLHSLETLDLGWNDLTGNIPVELGVLNNLKELALSSNDLTGNIPSIFGNLSQLERLALDRNQVVGPIPPEIGHLNSLKFLTLFGNELSGSIPSELGNLSNAIGIYLRENNLTGNIPVSLSNLHNLVDLHLSGNELSGHIPPELASMSSLSTLYLRGNQLSGCYDPVLANLCNQLASYASTNRHISDDNNFDASWEDFCATSAGSCTPNPPTSCQDTDSLALIAIYDSTDGANWTNTWDLNKPIYTWFGVYLDAEGCVTCLDLDGNSDCELSFNSSGNELVGTLPKEIGNLIGLKHLSVSFNDLTGAIPHEIGNLINIEHLDLGINSFTDTIPDAIQNLTSLKYLLLDENELTGIIPSKIGNLDSLKVLYLSNNQLEGNIPVELSSLNSMDTLYLNGNQLSGTIPSELGNLDKLISLSLSYNNLIGSIPTELSNIDSLRYLHLSFNNLKGCYPTSLNTLCEKLVSSPVLISNGNSFDASFEDFCNNGLGACTPNSSCTYADSLVLVKINEGLNIGWQPDTPIGSWTGINVNNNGCVDSINLSGMNISGELPPDIGELSDLRYLNISNTSLSGIIPPEIGNLTNLEDLRMFDTQLSGSIPPQIGNLINLRHLWLFLTRLSGDIPPEISNLTNLTHLDFAACNLSGSIPTELGDLNNLIHFSVKNNMLSGCFDTNLSGIGEAANNSKINTGNDFEALWEDFLVGEAGTCNHIQLDAKVILEGAFDTAEYKMTTRLNTERGLLPGQTPSSELTKPTPPGQPYARPPWNYTGREGINFTDIDYLPSVVDWILVSLRTDINKSSEVAKVAALLHEDGCIELLEQHPLTTSHQGPFYLVVEHRNHMGVMSPTRVSLDDNTLSFDFTIGNSYTASEAGTGQNSVLGMFMMIAGDYDQAADTQSYDINGSDKTIWQNSNGEFSKYLSADSNLDGDVNGADKANWKVNNGMSSRVLKE